ncbi:hypothetical protein ACH429_17295 [Streptomyces pathocidini]|uniref:Uncharacterized protein n=1 Tax=Streptomyces pathocidini TaxID=1650571 RepID=A0ABW7UW42_9ACTN|nr:hypothetical protein [Streptomyces pathocidini]
MTTPAPFEGLPSAGQQPAYQCWATAYPLHGLCPILLGASTAATPRLALRWLRDRTGHITDQLDAPYAQPGRHWLWDEADHERALTYLAAGRAYQLTLHDESAQYVLVVYPSGTAW